MQPQEFDPYIILHDNKPLDDFCGLSANQVNYLFYDTFDPKSSLQFCETINSEVLDQIPFFRLTEALLRIVEREKVLKLTTLGALPKKVITELYSLNFIPEYNIESGISKLTREQDSISVFSAHIVANVGGFIKKRDNKLTLTTKGKSLLLSENRVELFKQIFITFVDKFNWCINDRYTDYFVARSGWAFSIFLLLNYGDQQKTIDFYSDKYITAFPKFIDCFISTYALKPYDLYRKCYGVRTLDRFMDWFGFVTINQIKKHPDRNVDTFTSSQLLRKIFVFD